VCRRTFISKSFNSRYHPHGSFLDERDMTMMDSDRQNHSSGRGQDFRTDAGPDRCVAVIARVQRLPAGDGTAGGGYV